MIEKILELISVLLINPKIDVRELTDKIGVSENQLRYLLKNINVLLKDKNLKSIERKNNKLTEFELSELSELIRSLKKDRFYSKDERIQLLVALLIIQPDYISLDYLSFELQVSKNTVLRDLSFVKKQLDINNLELTYERNEGYQIVGNEFLIRNSLKKLLMEIATSKRKKILLNHINNLIVNILEIDEYQLGLIEKILGRNFTDDLFEIMPIFINGVIRRSKLGYVIPEKLNVKDIDEDYIKQIRDYSTFKGLEDTEINYLLIQLLSTKISENSQINSKIYQDLSEILLECISEFSSITSIAVKDKSQLLDSLLLHLVPGYFRIKYLTEYEQEKDEFIENIFIKYKFMINIIKQCCTSLEQYFGLKISEIEWLYITMIFMAHSNYQINDNNIKFKTAIVICPKGITYSQLIQSQLIEIFPELRFYDPMSYRSFRKSGIDVDIIFTVGHHYNEENSFYVEPLLTDKEKLNFRNLVLNKVFNIKGSNELVEEIIEVIGPYIDKKANKIIKEKISDILNYNELNFINDNKINIKNNNELFNYLSLSRIQLIEKINGYKQAIHKAAQPLLQEKIISKNYIDKLIQNYNFDDPYMIIGNKTVLPHDNPKYGVDKTGISLLVVKSGVKFAVNKKVNLIFLLAPGNENKYKEAILNILSLVENEKLVDKIINCTNKKEILDLIGKL